MSYKSTAIHKKWKKNRNRIFGKKGWWQNENKDCSYTFTFTIVFCVFFGTVLVFFYDSFLFFGLFSCHHRSLHHCNFYPCNVDQSFLNHQWFDRLCRMCMSTCTQSQSISFFYLNIDSCCQTILNCWFLHELCTLVGRTTTPIYVYQNFAVSFLI